MKMIEKTDEITNYVKSCVRRGSNGRISISKSSQIRCKNTVAMVGQEVNLMAPGIPDFREAMKKQDERSSSLFNYVHPYPICSDPVVIHIHHHHHGVLLVHDFYFYERERVKTSNIEWKSAAAHNIKSCELAETSHILYMFWE